MSGAIILTDEMFEFESGIYVLIPDEWGNHSDQVMLAGRNYQEVLIPDEWGNHSDRYALSTHRKDVCLNPR